MAYAYNTYVVGLTLSKLKMQIFVQVVSVALFTFDQHTVDTTDIARRVPTQLVLAFGLFQNGEISGKSVADLKLCAHFTDRGVSTCQMHGFL